jgi:hypothetical protein
VQPTCSPTRWRTSGSGRWRCSDSARLLIAFAAVHRWWTHRLAPAITNRTVGEGQRPGRIEAWRVRAKVRDTPAAGRAHRRGVVNCRPECVKGYRLTSAGAPHEGCHFRGTVGLSFYCRSTGGFGGRLVTSGTARPRAGPASSAAVRPATRAPPVRPWYSLRRQSSPVNSSMSRQADSLTAAVH